MPDSPHRGNDEPVAAAVGESAALIELREPIADETRIIILRDGSLREGFDHNGEYAERIRDDAPAEEDHPHASRCETCFLAKVLCFAGAVVGFLMGGPVGAAFGSAVGELSGDIATGRANMIWPKLGRVFFYPKGSDHEDDVCDRGSYPCHDAARGRCKGQRNADS
jgi:hypothetical protein